MFETTPLGTVRLQTPNGRVPLTINLVTGPRQTTTTAADKAATRERPTNGTVTVVGEISDYAVDLGVRAENVNVANLPTAIERLVVTAPVAGLIVEYEHRLANLTVHLAGLGLATGDGVAVALTAADLDYLRHCLAVADRVWRGAIEKADAAAQQPQQDTPPRPGHLNIEPTPAGYRNAARIFDTELARIERFDQRLARLLALAHKAAGDDGDPE